ncbi:MAG: hypothetical protein J3K34DRAFT_164310 [Monoraphidium minutum]|nr:MAG: hypothetical protein J3K34DRAFT_164310 [Monoraphidium minutum]
MSGPAPLPPSSYEVVVVPLPPALESHGSAPGPAALAPPGAGAAPHDPPGVTGMQLAQQLEHMAHDPGALAQLAAGRSMLQQQVAAAAGATATPAPAQGVGAVGPHTEALRDPQQQQQEEEEAPPDAQGADGPPAKRARVDDQAEQQQQAQAQAGAPEGGAPPPDLPPEEEPDEDNGGGGDGGGGGRGGPRPTSARDHRLRQRRWWALRRRYADLTAQVEAALCEAKALIAWRACPRAPRAARLSPQEREVLAVQHNRRLFDVASKACLGVIKAMMVAKFSWPFNRPVDVKMYPDYSQVVAEPMDFGTMKDKAERGGYRDPQQVYTDFMLVFSNGRLYNPPGSDVYYMATVLQEAFLEQWRKAVVPKLQECAKQSAGEEATMAARKLATARAEEEREMQDAACRLVAALDDLHEQLAAVRVEAALACEPLAPEARSDLARELAALPTAQLEAALGLVLPQMAPHLASAGGAEARQEVEVDLGRCSALELRQLQSFLAACHDAGAGGGGGPGAELPAGGGRGGAGCARELSGFPAGVLRDQTLSEHAGVVWPGVVVGAGIKARSVTLLPGGPRTDDPAAVPQLPPSKAKADVAAAAGGAPALGPPPPKAPASRRFSDTGTSALRPPLPPQRSRLGQLPPTPTQQQQQQHLGAALAAGAQHAPHQQQASPFASPAAGASAAADAAAAQHQRQHALGASEGGGLALHGMPSVQGSSDAGSLLPGAAPQARLGAAPAAGVDGPALVAEAARAQQLALRSGDDADMAGA